MRNTIHNHVSFPAGHPLPLRWHRLPMLMATLLQSFQFIIIGARALEGSSKLEMALNMQAQRTGAMVIFDLNDIRNTTIVLIAVASLLALTSLIFSLSLLYDWIRHLLRTRSQEKMGSSDQLAIQSTPFSTRTLGFQTVVLPLFTVWLLAILILSTLFIWTRSARLTIQELDVPGFSLSISTKYWDYDFLRSLTGIGLWITPIYSFQASFVTWFAWKYPRATKSGPHGDDTLLKV